MQVKKRAFIFFGGAVAVVSLVAWSANYHFIYGSDVSGIRVQKKLSPSLSETIVNLDAVGAMPMVVARAQYPLFIESLLRSSTPKSASTPCHKIYEGMMYSQAEELCGRPDIVGNSSNGEQTYYWPSGVSANVANNILLSVRK